MSLNLKTKLNVFTKYYKKKPSFITWHVLGMYKIPLCRLEMAVSVNTVQENNGILLEAVE